MVRQLREKFDDHLTYDRILRAHERAAKSKGLRYEVLQFNLNMHSNLMRIMDALASGKYLPSKYWRFWVYDPKKRLILALPYPDRVVHQWYIEEFIKPYYIPRFIYDSYACIPGKGTHAAVDRIQRYMRRMNCENNGHYCILKMDISKFFNSINLNILFDVLQKVIVDPKLLDLTYTILFEDGEHDGLPIGNYVSQYFANIYLNELDQFCKRQLGIKFYVRYMDDFVALAPNRLMARQWFNEINEFVVSQLNLRLNQKSRYYPAKLGLDFVGYRIYNDYRLLRLRSKKKLASLISDYERGVIGTGDFVQCINAWHGHARHADAHRLVDSRLGKYRDILPAVFRVDSSKIATSDLRESTKTTSPI